jgi:hypothetical protein
MYFLLRCAIQYNEEVIRAVLERFMCEAVRPSEGQYLATHDVDATGAGYTICWYTSFLLTFLPYLLSKI